MFFIFLLSAIVVWLNPDKSIYFKIGDMGIDLAGMIWSCFEIKKIHTN